MIMSLKIVLSWLGFLFKLFSQDALLIVDCALFSSPALEHSALRQSLLAGTWLTHSNGYLLFACGYFVDNFHIVTRCFMLCQYVSKIQDVTQEIKKNPG